MTGGTPDGRRPLSGTRKQQILAAAADLLAQRGYHSVGIADIGHAAGITGPAIYRHFPSKSAVLVALLDGVVDDLLRVAAGVVQAAVDPAEALDALVEHHVQFVLTRRVLIQVYLQEVHNLPPADADRLRRKQRRYVDQWEGVLLRLRPELSEAEAHSVVHAAIGAIQSSVHYASRLGTERLARVLAGAAAGVLRADSPLGPVEVSGSRRTPTVG